MRLYLSSYLWGNDPDKLFGLVNGPKHVGLVTNSADQFPEEGIVKRLQDDVAFLKKAGFSSERLDLRDYFVDNTGLEEKLDSFGLIWVRGANVFVLRRAMAQSGFDKLLIDRLRKDGLAYGGYSAGACVMGSTLRGLDLVDDATITPAGYRPEIIWDGLGILPYAVAPHYKSDHPESPDIDKSVQYFKDNHIAYKTLRDGEVLMINGNAETLLK